MDQVRPELPSPCGTLRDLFAVLPGFPHMWLLLSILFAVFAVVLEIWERAHQVVSRLNLPAPLFTHESVVERRLAGRVGASAPVTRFRGKHSRSHTGGRGTVLEKDSGKYRRSITIEPVDCHSYKILQSRVHSFAWFGAGNWAEGFFFNWILVVDAFGYIFYWCLRVKSASFSARYVLCKNTCCLTVTRRSSAPANAQ